MIYHQGIRDVRACGIPIVDDCDNNFFASGLFFCYSTLIILPKQGLSIGCSSNICMRVNRCIGCKNLGGQRCTLLNHCKI